MVVGLRTVAPGIRVHWGRAAHGFCQHQKLWLVDGGGLGATAFVGGITLNPHSSWHRGTAGSARTMTCTWS